MSVCLSPSPALTASGAFDPSPQRKRTSSFYCGSSSSSPRPLKSAKTCSSAVDFTMAVGTRSNTLRRSESYLFLPPQDCAFAIVSQSAPHHDGSSVVPYARSMRYYKEQREQRKAYLRRRDQTELTINTRVETFFPSESLPLPVSHAECEPAAQPCAPTIPFAKLPTGTKILLAQTHADATVERISGKTSSLRFGPSPAIVAPTPIRPPPPPPSIGLAQSSVRLSSPLAPVQRPLPPRPKFPRSKSKQKTNLLQKAIRGLMHSSPEGRRLLALGPRASLSVAQATSELEQLIAMVGPSDLGDEDMDLDIEEEDLAVVDAEIDGDADADAEGEIDDSATMETVPLRTSPTSPTASGLSNSWVCVPTEDWEMIDSAA
ncbi:hypothetical protein HGRIS_000883 [Hohenbuehelia grisea]|uniref:Uncharacterized protein n=1 Tax=Hohenbuehelia grisea TaxID=104357 RepID=A0ABR3IQ58_9AGAR